MFFEMIYFKLKKKKKHLDVNILKLFLNKKTSIKSAEFF